MIISEKFCPESLSLTNNNLFEVIVKFTDKVVLEEVEVEEEDSGENNISPFCEGKT